MRSFWNEDYYLLVVDIALNIAWNSSGILQRKEKEVSVMMFSVTFNNISVISWLSVVLVEETRVTGENHWPLASHWQTLSHNVV